jgi:hypothetical protein
MPLSNVHLNALHKGRQNKKQNKCIHICTGYSRYGALAQEYKDPDLFVVVETGSNTPPPASANTAILAFSAFSLSSL